MQAGDLVRVRRQLFWRGRERPRAVVPGCLALVVEVRDDLTPADRVDALTWSAMGRCPTGARLMIGDTPYLIRLDPTDVEIL
jgi:hypothetical protein